MAFEEARAFVERFAEAAGAEAPSEEEFEAILDLAGVAAHASARQAAPVTCWLAAATGLSIAEARAIADRLADEDGSA